PTTRATAGTRYRASVRNAERGMRNDELTPRSAFRVPRSIEEGSADVTWVTLERKLRRLGGYTSSREEWSPPPRRSRIPAGRCGNEPPGRSREPGARSPKARLRPIAYRP